MWLRQIPFGMDKDITLAAAVHRGNTFDGGLFSHFFGIDDIVGHPDYPVVGREKPQIGEFLLASFSRWSRSMTSGLFQ